jgi:hypothetical protein
VNRSSAGEVLEDVAVVGLALLVLAQGDWMERDCRRCGEVKGSQSDLGQGSVRCMPGGARETCAAAQGGDECA